MAARPWRTRARARAAGPNRFIPPRHSGSLNRVSGDHQVVGERQWVLRLLREPIGELRPTVPLKASAARWTGCWVRLTGVG